jgi:hypothetical protein
LRWKDAISVQIAPIQAAAAAYVNAANLFERVCAIHPWMRFAKKKVAF